MRDATGALSLRFVQMVFNATFPLALPYSQVPQAPALCSACHTELRHRIRQNPTYHCE